MSDDGWISVEERLPEEYKTVMVFGACGLMFACQHKGAWNFRDDKYHGWVVTHWRPLPDPPVKREG